MREPPQILSKSPSSGLHDALDLLAMGMGAAREPVVLVQMDRRMCRANRRNLDGDVLLDSNSTMEHDRCPSSSEAVFEGRIDVLSSSHGGN